MKSWEDGKNELGRQFARICALIDKNISEEVNSSSMIPVEKEELKILRENSSKIAKLVENNARLVDELERCKAVAARVDILEKKNRALASELNQILSNTQSNDESKPQVDISHLQTILSTEDKIDAKEYQRMVKKYNVISENCNQLKGAWAKMERKLREQKRKSREWALHLENRDNIIKKKTLKIKKLGQELMELKDRIGIDGTSANKTLLRSISHKNDENLENKKFEKLIDNGPSKHQICFLEFENPSDLPQHKFFASDKSVDQVVDKNCVLPKLMEASGSADDKYHPINSPRITSKLQMSMKRKRESKDESHSGFESEIITKNFFRSQDFQHLKDSIDLDDVGQKFETPKKLNGYFQLAAKSNCASDSALLSSPIDEEVNHNNDCSNASCSSNENRNGDSFARKQKFPEKFSCEKTEIKCLSPEKSHAKSIELNRLFDKEQLKALSEPSSPVFESRACNKVTTPANLPFPSSLLSSKESRFHQEAPQQQSLSSKSINNQQRNLRALPIEKLDIQDFKINPDYNQGYNYAFSEVVRGHARKKLQGCLKPCCAPKYRALAEVSRKSSGKLSFSQEESDRLMLEEFLGDNAHKLQSMSGMDKEELLIQAKTRDLANKHGIHRHAYNNPETPVGIWNADFPTTQEALDDQKKITERKRKTVQARYAEAMRPGGAYKFRDE
ncbi:putative p-loop containing nucleoside triphosphate hydrolase [Erysiphe neolycopersici]|uniref:Putative p-loop containing nucleoside triphosphate hydrolase n=1 Tax=Erysiphe neolycopersici TaxID=212602 RepID=A0A420HB46_9PEZI|nr:putative p-loop containing nucleoside triphosphate hydrolase [Erysiphe neolycopersici]